MDSLRWDWSNMKNKTIKLTNIEIEDLLYLVDEMLDSGCYFGRKDYYINRLNKIKQKLQGALDE